MQRPSKRPHGTVGSNAKSKSSDIIGINVGGQIFTTTRATLCSQPGSMLARMFAAESPFQEFAQDDDERIYLDRDPEAFEHVLAFLRAGKLVRPPMMAENKVEDPKLYKLDPLALRVLAIEADYFGLGSLLKVVNELIDGFSATELAKAGFDVETLKDMGFDALTLKNAGFTPIQLWEHCVPYCDGVPKDTVVVARGGPAGRRGRFLTTSQRQGRLKLALLDERTVEQRVFKDGVRLVRFHSE